ncbi:hypothetical protein HLB03_09035, partial [Acidianus sp. DSM 29099]|nr:hypothetical protein [Acidianus sp. RZ1]
MFKQFTKALMSSPQLWGWGILFTIFWLFMGAYFFSRGVPDSNNVD